MSIEKRRFSRIPFKVNAEITVDNVVYPVAEIKNLSIGGEPFLPDFSYSLPCSRIRLPRVCIAI